MFLKQNATGNENGDMAGRNLLERWCSDRHDDNCRRYQVFAFYYNGTHVIASIVPDCHP